jgi:DNA polymerase-3 subunit alpha
MEAVEHVGLVKMDILAQGGLAVIRDTLALLAARGVTPDLEHLEPWEDPTIWRMIATGNARGVHHIESPAMISLSKMCNVHDIDCLIAIVSVIRPGAANGMKKAQFARRAQGLETPVYVHPSLAGVLRSTFGVVAYEEHILQICEEFAGLNPGRADVLRRALVKQKQPVIDEIGREFIHCARARGRSDEDIIRVWELVYGFQGYAFLPRAQHRVWDRSISRSVSQMPPCRGVPRGRAEQWERVLHRLGLHAGVPPTRNPIRFTRCERIPLDFVVEGGATIRVPLRTIKDLTQKTLARWKQERASAPFESLRDFYLRVGPDVAEVLNLIRVGAFDSFRETRTVQFWKLRRLAQWPNAQGFLFRADEGTIPIEAPLTEPAALQRLQDEMELLGFTVSGHPLDLYPEIAWDTYCSTTELHRYAGQTVITCGLTIADRSHHQITGDQMKFITLCDYTGMVECEIFAESYRRFGLVTIQYPVVEIEAAVTPFENGLGFTLDVKSVRKPRGWRAPSS